VVSHHSLVLRSDNIPYTIFWSKQSHRRVNWTTYKSMRRYEANLALQLGGVMVAVLYCWPLFVFCDGKWPILASND
jgi:hypothetical protein